MEDANYGLIVIRSPVKGSAPKWMELLAFGATKVARTCHEGLQKSMPMQVCLFQIFVALESEHSLYCLNISVCVTCLSHKHS